MIQAIFWDVDGTLLDFEAAEKAAIQALFPRFGLGECTDERIGRYSRINKRYWERMESGELTKEQVLIGRYEEFFRTEGLDVSVAAAFNNAYQEELGETAVFRDDSHAIVSALRGRLPQYAVSNGTVIAQHKKLKKSGLWWLLDGIFLSEELGVEKPNKAFFDRVFAAVGPLPGEEVLIVGDSLTSDIRGGLNAGLRTCWYNPGGAARHVDILPEWEIGELHQLGEILELENGIRYF